MIDVQFLTRLTNPDSARHEWLHKPRRITLDGELWYCATQGSIAVAVLVSQAAPLEADLSEVMAERVKTFLSPPASTSLAYGAFKAWVGSVVEAKVVPCSKCDGKGKYDCNCGEPCCKGYVDPCDDCKGKKTITETPKSRFAMLEPRFAPLASLWVNRTLLATAFAHLDADSAFIRFPDGPGPVLVSSAAWRVAFMPLDYPPTSQQEVGEAFTIQATVETVT